MIRYIRTLEKRKLQGIALLRLDFNTEDEWRMRAAIPTIRFLLKSADKVVIISHRGRPKGAERKLSLHKDARALERFLKKEVHFVPHFRFGEIRRDIERAPRGSVFLLENIRFLKGELENSRKLGRNLARLGDYFVNDAFAVSHRSDASIQAITKFLPSYAGPELEKEIRFLSHVLARPKHPLVFIVGGGKAHDKLAMIGYFRKKADYFLLGGIAANTLLRLRGVDVGKSQVDNDQSDIKRLREIVHYSNLVLPEDFVMQKNSIFDMGPKSIHHFLKIVKKARTIVWAGPIGAIEEKKFQKGTLALAKAVAENRRAYSVVGGGETVMFLKKMKLDKKISFISTGGGAMIDFLAGKKLPGIEALKK